MLTRQANEATCAGSSAAFSKIALSMQSPILASHEHIGSANTDTNEAHLTVASEPAMPGGLLDASNDVVASNDGKLRSPNRITSLILAACLVIVLIIIFKKVIDRRKSLSEANKVSNKYYQENETTFADLKTKSEEIKSYPAQIRKYFTLSDPLHPDRDANEQYDDEDYAQYIARLDKLATKAHLKASVFRPSCGVAEFKTECNDFITLLERLPRSKAHDDLVKNTKELKQTFDPEEPQFIVDVFGKDVTLAEIEDLRISLSKKHQTHQKEYTELFNSVAHTFYGTVCMLMNKDLFSDEQKERMAEIEQKIADKADKCRQLDRFVASKGNTTNRMGF